jgi:hypothetical protein
MSLSLQQLILLPPSRVVDWTSADPARNMYGCLMCPRCRGVYRYPHKDGGRVPVICCDDCGLREPIVLVVE